MALLKLLQKSLDLQDILLIFLSVGKVAGSVMLPAVLEEHTLSLLEEERKVKGGDFNVRHSKLSEVKVRELHTKDNRQNIPKILDNFVIIC